MKLSTIDVCSISSRQEQAVIGDEKVHPEFAKAKKRYQRPITNYGKASIENESK